jgi:ribonuclease P protein component
VLAADQRLRDSDSFRRAVKSGRRAGSAALVVHLHVSASSPSDATPRLGLVVGKVVGNAVVRNRVKRRLRHVVKHYLTALPPGAELVIRAQPPAAVMSSAELDVEVGRCLQRTGLTAALTGAAS